MLVWSPSPSRLKAGVCRLEYLPRCLERYTELPFESPVRKHRPLYPIETHPIALGEEVGGQCQGLIGVIGEVPTP